MAAGMPMRAVLVSAPSRIPHGEAVRNAVRVEWMRLDDIETMRRARGWVDSHGLLTHISAGGPRGYVLLVWTDSGALDAELGQVLAFNPTSGEFTVWDADRFDEAHSEVTA